MKKTTLYLVTTFLLAMVQGCSTTALTEKKAQKYSHMDIYEFVQERFIPNRAVYKGVDKTLDTAFKPLNTIRSKDSKRRFEASRARYEADEKTTGLMPDGKTVIFKAYFTGPSKSDLYRPRKDLESYCLATGGEFITIHQNTFNFIDQYFKSPQQAYLDAFNGNYEGSVSYNVGGVRFNDSLNSLRPMLAEAAAREAENLNHRLDKSGGEHAYMSAALEGSFGVFACKEEPFHNYNWKVSISPFDYKPRDPNNQLVPHELKLIIIPEA